MKNILFILVIFFSACSKATEKNQPPENQSAKSDSSENCNYNDSTTYSSLAEGGDITKYKKESYADDSSGESGLKEHLLFSNGDKVTIEHSYCYMYNYTLKYVISGDKKPSSLVESLPKIERLIGKSKAADALKHPFAEIVLETLSMQQKMLKMPFSVGLPSRYTTTSDNVEYEIEYRVPEGTSNGAEFEIYIGIGGA